jgi:hypothetical protein
VIGAKITPRFVYEPIDVSLAFDRLAIDAYALSWFNPRAQFAGNLPVNAHAAGGDKLIALPSRADPGMCQVFV